MSYEFDKRMTVEAHVFAAGAGTSAARECLKRALRDPEFPDDLKDRAADILRRVIALEQLLSGYSDAIRRRTVQAAEDHSSYVAEFNWAMVGIEGTIRELQGAVRKGGRAYSRAIQDATAIIEDVRALFDELREYEQGYHPLEWTIRTLKNLSESVPQAFSQWTYAPPPLARVASVGAKDHAVVVAVVTDEHTKFNTTRKG